MWIFLAAGCSEYALGNRVKDPSMPQPDIEVVPAFVRFDSIPPGCTAEQTVTVSNVGEAPLEVDGAWMEGDPSLTSMWLSGTLDAGASTELTVRFSPTVDGGATGALVVSSDDPDEPEAGADAEGIAASTGDVVDTYVQDNRPVDVLWVTPKATQLGLALNAVPDPVLAGMVVPLLNGVDHVPLLRSRFDPDRVVPGTIAGELERTAPGRIVHRSPFASFAFAATGQPGLGWAADSIVVNVQGDEPLLPLELIDQVAALLAANKIADVATLATRLRDRAQFLDPAAVKLVTDVRGYALYFSRAPIPWQRDATPDAEPPMIARRHLGLYAYRAAALKRLAVPASAAACELENLEKLEQLRILALGYRIIVADAVAEPGPDVNTPQDVAAVEALLRA